MVYHYYSVRFYTLSIYLCIRILKNQNYRNKGILRKRDVFRKPTRPSLSLRKGVLKSSRPSLPLKKAPPLTPALFNGLYTPFGSPVCGGQKPQERGRKPPSGAQNRYALRLADHQRSSPCYAGWDRLAVAGGDLMLLQSPRHGCAGWDRLGIAVYSLQLIVIVYG